MTKDDWSYKIVINTSLYFEGEGPKFGLACKEIEALKGFWYQSARVECCFRNSPPPICITVDVIVIVLFLAVPPPKLGSFWKKLHF